MTPVVDRNAVLGALYGSGKTLKKWCEEEGVSYQAASSLVRGVSPGRRGQVSEIAKKLNALTKGAA